MYTWRGAPPKERSANICSRKAHVNKQMNKKQRNWWAKGDGQMEGWKEHKSDQTQRQSESELLNASNIQQLSTEHLLCAGAGDTAAVRNAKSLPW